MSNFKEDRQETADLRHKGDQAEIFLQWLHTPDGRPFAYMAAISQIKNYYNQDDWSLADLTESANILVEKGIISPLTQDRMESDAARAKRESEEAEAQERIDLTNFICKARVMQPETEKSERERFLSQKATDITTLRQIKENILAKRELQAKSVQELKTIVRPEPYSAPTDLPSHISRAQILHLMDGEQLRHLIDKYGSAAVTKRVNERKKERDQ